MSSKDTLQQGFNMPPDKAVYAASADGHLYAFDSTTSSLLWRFNTDSSILGAPAAADRTIYTANTDGHLYAIDALTGELIWTYSTDSVVFSDVSVDTTPTNTTTVYLGSRDHHIHAVDANTGQKRWSFDTDGRILGGVAVSGNRVFVGNVAGKIYALDTGNGIVRWEKRYTGIYGSPIVVNNSVFISTSGKNLYRLDAETGSEDWKTPIKGVSQSTPIYCEGNNDLIYTGSDSAFQAFYLDGSPAFEKTSIGNSKTDIRDGAFAFDSNTSTLCVGTEDQSLYGFSTETRELKWHCDLDKPDKSTRSDNCGATPMISDGTIYVSGAENVYALQPQSGRRVWSMQNDCAWRVSANDAIEKSPVTVTFTGG